MHTQFLNHKSAQNKVAEILFPSVSKFSADVERKDELIDV
jgi:hypothetical protein